MFLLGINNSASCSQFNEVYTYFNTYLPPANEVCEGYVFTPVCQSFCSQGGVPGQVPPWDQVSPRPGTPPGTRYTPLGTRYTPSGPDTPPRTRYTPLGPGTPRWDQVHPLPKQCMLGDTGNKWAVSILLECILVS